MHSSCSTKVRISHINFEKLLCYKENSIKHTFGNIENLFNQHKNGEFTQKHSSEISAWKSKLKRRLNQLITFQSKEITPAELQKTQEITTLARGFLDRTINIQKEVKSKIKLVKAQVESGYSVIERLLPSKEKSINHTFTKIKNLFNKHKDGNFIEQQLTEITNWKKKLNLHLRAVISESNKDITPIESERAKKIKQLAEGFLKETTDIQAQIRCNIRSGNSKIEMLLTSKEKSINDTFTKIQNLFNENKDGNFTQKHSNEISTWKSKLKRRLNQLITFQSKEITPIESERVKKIKQLAEGFLKKTIDIQTQIRSKRSAAEAPAKSGNKRKREEEGLNTNKEDIGELLEEYYKDFEMEKFNTHTYKRIRRNYKEIKNQAKDRALGGKPKSKELQQAKDSFIDYLIDTGCIEKEKNKFLRNLAYTELFRRLTGFYVKS